MATRPSRSKGGADAAKRGAAGAGKGRAPASSRRARPGPARVRVPEDVFAETWTTLRVAREDAVARVTLDRPEVRNAFNDVMVRELAEVCAGLDRDRTVRVVVLAGSGEAFCAGADLRWMQRTREYSYRENFADSLALADMLHRLYRLSHPTVARVQGAVIGGGNGLVAACDLAVAARDALFGLSEVRLGLMPSCIGPYVVKKVGEGAARMLFLTGERIPAERALALGFVTEVADPAELDEKVNARVRQLLSGGPEAQASCKRLLEELADASFARARRHTAELIARMRVGDEAQEGMAAFLEKRKPRWSS